MNYHGIPRYVWPSIPFVMVTFSYIVDYFFHKQSTDNISCSIQECIDGKKFPLREKILNFLYPFYIAIFLFAAIIFTYSIFIFSKSINSDMHSYRLGKYFSSSPEDVRNNWTFKEKHTFKGDEVIFRNTKRIKDTPTDSICHHGLNHLPMIFTLKLPPNTLAEYVVTEVQVNGHGGYLFDYMTTYWTLPNSEQVTFSENSVYSFPTYPISKRQTVLIDGNVSRLTVIPFRFRGGKYCLKSALIRKYVRPKKGGDL